MLIIQRVLLDQSTHSLMKKLKIELMTGMLLRYNRKKKEYDKPEEYYKKEENKTLKRHNRKIKVYYLLNIYIKNK